MIRRRPVVLGTALALLLAGAVTLVEPAIARTGLALVGCLLLPGLGWARKMRFGDRGDTVALAVVLSICLTVAVGTAMAVADAWSLGGGLVALGVIAAAGFVPFRALVGRAGTGAQRRIAGFGDDGGAWADWYQRTALEARRRRRRAEAEAEAAADVWVDWYVGAGRRSEGDG